MNLESTKKLVNSVIENEFRHISESKEFDAFNADVEISSSSEKMEKLLEKINKLLPEDFELMSDLESVIAGTTNLRFLEETHIMNMI